MIFGIDLDGVVYKWSETAKFMLEDQFDIKVPDQTCWGTWDKELTKEHWDWLWTDGIKEGLFRHGHIYKGSIDALNQLATMGDIMIITSRPKAAHPDTLEWLAFHRVPTSRVIMLGPGANKADVLPHCDMYVDDKVTNCNQLAVDTDGKILLWDRPWSFEKGENLDNSVSVVTNWEQVLNHACWLTNFVDKEDEDA